MASAVPVVVVGAGLAGAGAAWALARRGHEVTVLERSHPANEWGSSHGSARIFRYAYPDPFYADLVVQARALWDVVERDAATALIRPTGSIDHGALREPARIAAALATAGVAHEVLPAAEAAARWPGMAFDGEVVWHGAAGVIDAERAVEAMLDLARADGARVEPDWPVAAVRRAGAGYRVVAEDGRVVEAAQVVVAAGGWLPDLLGDLGLDAATVERMPRLEVRQEQAFHFPYRDDPHGWPTFIHKTADMQVYGLPGGRDADGRGQKVAEYNGGRRIRSAAAGDRAVDPANRARVIEYVRRHLPGLEPEPYAETTCLFTNTPDEEFVIDRVDGVTVLSPCSGHGAKFAPLIGELAARLVAGEGPVPPRFRPLAARPPGSTAGPPSRARERGNRRLAAS